MKQQLPDPARLSLPVKLILLASIVVVVAADLSWSELGARAGHPSAPVPVLTPEAIARGVLDRTALSWLEVRHENGQLMADFSPLLRNAAALDDVRYGVDQPIPDQTLVLPDKRREWPLPPEHLGMHSIVLPPQARFVSLSVRFKDGSKAPIVLYSLNGKQ